VGADRPSPTSPEHQLDWPSLGFQYQQMQAYENCANISNANPSFYQNNNQQPLFIAPNFGKSGTAWPGNDFCYPTEDNVGDASTTRIFNDAQSKDAGAP
jgi:hypothetical protein